MKWWQSLLIALIPSILTALITLIVSLVQINRTKAEIETKYISDKKQHISKLRLNMEFDIYKELSEKVMELVSVCVILFRDVDIGEAIKQDDKAEFIELRKRVVKAYNEANIAINKHAIFIPDNWYDKFMKIKILCFEHMNAHKKYLINGECKGKSVDDIKKETDNSMIEIGNLMKELIKDLRKYIENFGSNESN